MCVYLTLYGAPPLLDIGHASNSPTKQHDQKLHRNFLFYELIYTRPMAYRQISPSQDGVSSGFFQSCLRHRLLGRGAGFDFRHSHHLGGGHHEVHHGGSGILDSADATLDNRSLPRKRGEGDLRKLKIDSLNTPFNSQKEIAFRFRLCAKKT